MSSLSHSPSWTGEWIENVIVWELVSCDKKSSLGKARATNSRKIKQRTYYYFPLTGKCSGFFGKAGQIKHNSDIRWQTPSLWKSFPTHSSLTPLLLLRCHLVWNIFVFSLVNLGELFHHTSMTDELNVEGDNN